MNRLPGTLPGGFIWTAKSCRQSRQPSHSRPRKLMQHRLRMTVPRGMLLSSPLVKSLGRAAATFTSLRLRQAVAVRMQQLIVHR